MTSMAKKTGKKSRSSKAGLCLPVGRIHKIMRKGNFAPRVGDSAAVCLTAVVEYLAAEIMDLASEVAVENRKARLMPRHIVFAIKKDEELSRMLSGVTISQGGVLPAINAMLLPKKTMKKSETDTSGSQQF